MRETAGRLSVMREVFMGLSFAAAMVLSVLTWLVAMRSGVRALERVNR